MKLFFIRTGPDRLSEQETHTRINPLAPLLTILTFIGLSAALFYSEIGIIQSGKAENEKIGINTNKIRDQAQDIKNQTTYVKTHQEEIKKVTDSLLTGVSQQPLSQDAFKPLFDLAINIQPITEASPTKTTVSAGSKNQPPDPNFTYSLTSNLIEWHRLLPAIAATESQFPLLHFTKLQFTSPQPAFYNQATPLNFSGQFITAKPPIILSLIR